MLTQIFYVRLNPMKNMFRYKINLKLNGRELNNNFKVCF